MSRLHPYTKRGLHRLACFRCAARPATEQWRLAICATGNDQTYRPMCDACDVALNRMVLEWAKLPGWREVADAYEQRDRSPNA